MGNRLIFSSIKRILISFLIIGLILPFTIVSSTSQNNSPTLSIPYASGQSVSQTQIQQYMNESPIIGNVFYEITVNMTITFPSNTFFEGVYGFGCGIDVSLVNTPAWQIVYFFHSCPMITNRQVSAGTYNFQIYFYINSLKNYVGTNFPATIGFYAYTSLNTPQFNSSAYFFNLLTNKSVSNPTIHNNLNSFGFIALLSSIAILTIVKFKRYSNK